MLTHLQVLSFLLSHPVITAGLALFLYLVVPRLWRAAVRFVVIPAGVLATLFVVVKNPQSFSTAGSFVVNCTLMSGVQIQGFRTRDDNGVSSDLHIVKLELLVPNWSS